MKFLIVGAGFSGAVLARELFDAGHYVHVIDEKHHFAGHAYDYMDSKTGIRIHKYGPHLFHTKNKKVYDYLGHFTEWVPYKHKVKALLSDGTYVTLPVNEETAEIVGVGNIIDTFYRPYTKKMWGMDLEELDPSIINRVPIRADMNEYYFPDDAYQALPKDGYTNLIENILKPLLDNSDVYLNAPFHKTMETLYDHVFYSGPIDQYYDYQFGDLPYRSISFTNIDIPAPGILPAATVNFTHNGAATRMTEWSKLPNSKKNPGYTTITVEYPCDYKENNSRRYYPVKDVDGKNRALYMKYKNIPNEKVTFIGRCGQYVYIDMDQAVNASLALAERWK